MIASSSLREGVACGHADRNAEYPREVHAGHGRTLVVTWKGGAESVIDVAEHLVTYTILVSFCADDSLFDKVTVDDWGWCAHWSDDREISSDTLWRLALERGSAWLRIWRTDHQITQAEAAKALGVNSRMWRYYEAGTHLLPKTVRLAAAGLDAQVQAT